jgi:predicted RNA binding protein YcfA (HicA-like mRNA interferase family)
MSQKEKLIEKFLANPASVKYRELVIILEHYGFEKISVRGSHVKFKHIHIPYDLIIPVHNNDCNNFYKKMAKDYIIKLK